MCPIWPLHIVFLYILTLFPLWAICQLAPRLTKEFRPNVIFEPAKIELHMDTYADINMNVTGLEESGFHEGNYLQLYMIDKDHIASVNDTQIVLTSSQVSDGWRGVFRLHANFLGWANVGVRVGNHLGQITANGSMPVIVTRPERVIDTVFTSSVATLVSILYINFGCAVDWNNVKSTIKRPIGPVIGFVGQFLIMPMLTYVLGLIIFPDDVTMRLGMFFTGVSPAGGASNIWTFVLGGNLDLSITMTTISTISAFAMMPLWLFTLGRSIMESGNIRVPYGRIAGFVAALVIPLGIGLLIQKYLPRISSFLVRILKVLSILILLFIIVFAIVTNLYLFELFSWQIIVAGMGVPWIAYILGYLAARIFCQSNEDALAIALETGIQNTGIAIFLLRFALTQPAADLTTVVPVSIAIMTPFPLMALYAYQKIRDRCGSRGQHKKIQDEETPSLPYSGTTETIMPAADKY